MTVAGRYTFVTVGDGWTGDAVQVSIISVRRTFIFTLTDITVTDSPPSLVFGFTGGRLVVVSVAAENNRV